jgi:pre-rRNA-processing protein TSR3
LSFALPAGHTAGDGFSSPRFEVLVDRTERLGKCTILPLNAHPAVDIVRFPRGQKLPPLAGALLLHPAGAPLDELPRGAYGAAPVLSVIDCRWKRLPSIVRAITAPLPRLARIPDGFVTAYPRRNKKDLDPDAGLATIEAVFIAGAFLGRWDETLLAHYVFAAAFLAQNRSAFAHYGLLPIKPMHCLEPKLDGFFLNQKNPINLDP